MPEIVPSYITKVRRAKDDLINLQAEIDRYIARKPYTVVESREGKRKQKVRRLKITSDPANTDIPSIAGGIIYELRSALDHLMTALIPTEQRSRKGMFPIYFQGVWEPDDAGDNQQRLKERARWRSDTRDLGDSAVAVLKTLQPPDVVGKPVDETNVLQTINQLANADDHTKPPVTAMGLSDCILRSTLPDGSTVLGTGHARRDHLGRLDAFIENGAKLKDIPHRAVNVEIEGVPIVAIKVGSQQRYAPIPGLLEHAARIVEKHAIEPLIPYVVR